MGVSVWFLRTWVCPATLFLPSIVFSYLSRTQLALFLGCFRFAQLNILYPTLSRCRTRKNYIPSPEHLVDSTPCSREGCQWNQSALNAWTISAWWLRLSKIEASSR